MLAARIISQRVHVANAVGDVVAIRPHAIEGKVLDRSAPPDGLVSCWHVYLNHRALLDRHLFEGTKDAVLVLRGDRHKNRLRWVIAATTMLRFALIVAFRRGFSGLVGV